MAKPQPSYTKEFKQEAAKLVETSNKSKSEIARDLGISDSALSKWCKEFVTHGEQAFAGKGHQTSLEEEIKQLKRENEILRQERDILKKAVRIFAQLKSMKYMFIENHKEEFPILRMCQVLEVSESGYYAWLKREPSERERVDKELGELIEDAYQKNRGCVWKSTHSCRAKRSGDTL